MDFVGKPPFTYHYSFAGQRFTKSTATPRATFSTTEPGLFRLDEFSDFFNYTVLPEAQVLRDVKFVTPPTFSLDTPAYSCDNAEVDVTISITGQAPFSVQYPFSCFPISFIYLYFLFVLFISFMFISIYYLLHYLLPTLTALHFSITNLTITKYMLNQTSHTKRDIEGRFTFPRPTPPRQPSLPFRTCATDSDATRAYFPLRKASTYPRSRYLIWKS
jgi:hypothetical protein